MPNPKPAPCATLKIFRFALGLSQGEVAALLGVSVKTISDYETGEIAPDRPEVETKVGRMGCPPQAVDLAFEFLATVRGERMPGWPIPLSGAARAALLRTAAESARATREVLFERSFSAQVQADRARARATWARIEHLPAEDRLLAIERAPGIATWALADLLTARSLEAAPERHELALVLGELALTAAKAAPADATFRDHLAARAWAAICNAQRVAGQLRLADQALREARVLWPEGAPSPGNLLSEARLFDLEASLRRDQREFKAAHAAIDRALALTAAGLERGRVLLKQSSIFEQEGDFAGAVAATTAALDELGEDCPVHLGLLAHSQLTLNLDHLGRHEETLAAIPAARQLAIEARSQSNLLRLLWLEARSLAALGRGQEALAPFDQVRLAFAARGNLHDAALAGLELAALYLDEARLTETRALAG